MRVISARLQATPGSANNRRRFVAVSGACLVIELVTLADSAVAAALVRGWAAREGLDGTTAAELATCASELASNVVRHGGGGRLEVDSDAERVVLRANDRGHGEPERLAAHLHEVRARPVPARGEHGLATVLRWMDEVDVRARRGGGIEFVAARLRARRRRR